MELYVEKLNIQKNDRINAT